MANNMQATLKEWSTPNWGNGPSVVLSDADKKLCDGCRRGNVDEVSAALKSGADPNLQFRLALGEVTPIFLCAQKGYKDVAEVLCQNGANVEKTMDFDATLPLHHAASNGQAVMCEFLIEKKSNVNALDKLRRTPLMDAAEVGCLEAVKVLLKHGADIAAIDSEDFNALSYCIDFVSKKDVKFYETAKYLVQNGADVNSQGKFAKRTILHCAAAQGDTEFVHELVDEKKAKIKVKDNEGKTPVDYAKQTTHLELAEFLEQHAAADSSACSCVVL